MSSEQFEDESEYSKKYIKHDNRYGYIICPYCCCHHYMDNYIDDDFMNYEDAEFDFVAFCKIDDGIHYLNPKHFSIQQLIDYMHYFLTANR